MAKALNLYDSLDGERAVAQAQVKPPRGPGFPAALATKATRLEVWTTQAASLGDHYAEARLISKDGKVLAVRRLPAPMGPFQGGNLQRGDNTP